MDLFASHNNIPNLKGVECKFVVYIPGTQDGEVPDVHYVKERVHLNDGTNFPRLRAISNYERPFWIERNRDAYKDKKEWQDLARLAKFKSTESNLKLAVARALGTGFSPGALKRVFESPYVYGTSITASVEIKRQYQQKYKDIRSNYTVGVLDTETSMTNVPDDAEFGVIDMATFTCKETAVTAVTKSFVENNPNFVERCKEIAQRHIGDILEKRKINWELVILDTEIDVVKHVLNAAHLRQPDFLTFWNMDFDIMRIEEACKRANISPAEVWSDPRLPASRKYYHYKQSKEQKDTSSGKTMPVKPADRWHQLTVPASFFPICSMCTFRGIRQQSEQDSPSYKLDYILKKHIERGKLKIIDRDIPENKWHRVMQANFKAEYVVYNLFDCIGVELLDEKVKDLSESLPAAIGFSEIKSFKSQTTRLCDAMHYFLMDTENHVLGVSGSTMLTDVDDELIGREGWIVALAAHLLVERDRDVTLKMLEERKTCANDNIYAMELSTDRFKFERFMTRIYKHVADLDVSASYPNGEEALNISKETTVKELLDIIGVSEEIRREQGINLYAVNMNAYEFGITVLGLPTFDQVHEAFLEDEKMAA